MATREENWLSKDGKLIPVGELTEEHAKNILRMLIKFLRTGDEKHINHHMERLQHPELWHDYPYRDGKEDKK